MASGFDARIAIAKETVAYGTRAVPSRFLALTAEDLGYTYNRYFSPALGTGMWAAPSVVTTQVGSGSISGDVPTTGFGILLDGLHGNTVTPVQQAATPAYLQTHTLNSPPSKSYTIQVQTPPVTSSTLIPHEMQGTMLSGITLSWAPGGVLSFEIPTVYQTLDIGQTNVAYTPPAAYSLFSFRGGSISIGGVVEANVVGGGNIALAYSLRDDAFTLGSGGKIAKPVITDKPEATGTFTADFNDNTNLTRVTNNTIADVVLLFEGVTISGTHKETIQVTLPDCVFTSPRPTAGDPGPIQQTVSFRSASSTGDAPEILYKAVDIAI